MLDLKALITADVGGTSFDTALVLDGAPQILYEGNVDGMPVQTPWVDVRSDRLRAAAIDRHAMSRSAALMQVGAARSSSAGAQVPGALPPCSDGRGPASSRR